MVHILKGYAYRSSHQQSTTTFTSASVPPALPSASSNYCPSESANLPSATLSQTQVPSAATTLQSSVNAAEGS